jgi:hypothetical protein
MTQTEQPFQPRQPNVELAPEIRDNLGTRRIPPLRSSQFPDAGAAVQTLTSSTRPPGLVDVLLVNPPTPDGGIWIRSQHRVGRRSRENMIWPQVSLAQLAALLMPEYTVEIIDANALRMGWAEFERMLGRETPQILSDPGDGAHPAQRHVWRVSGQIPGRQDNGLWHPRHADDAGDAASLPGAGFCAARRAGNDAARAARYAGGQETPTRAWQDAARKQPTPEQGAWTPRRQRYLPGTENPAAHVLGLAWRQRRRSSSTRIAPSFPTSDDLPMPRTICCRSTNSACR